MNLISYPILGGIMTASWGAYKDTPYEGFSGWSYLRSILVTTIYFYILNNSVHEMPIFILLAAAACERFTQEIWKAFFRRKQRVGIYLIPQGFHILGKEMKSYSLKLVLGMIILSIFLVLFWLLLPLKVASIGWKILIVLGFGMLVSGGGAWKDAPIEGFEVAKFPRSMLVTGLAGILIANFVSSLGILILASLGLERYLVEFYKTYVVKKTPGKFIEKKIHYIDMINTRKNFAWVYFISLLGLMALMIWKLFSIEF